MPDVDRLVSRFDRARLTECIVRRKDRLPSDGPLYRAAYSVLVFEAATDSSRPGGIEAAAKYLTNHEEELAPNLGFSIFESTLSVDEALGIIGCDTTYTSPHAPGGPSTVECPGAWAGPILLGKEEGNPAWNCLPYIDHSCWIYEKWPIDEGLADELGDRGLRKCIKVVQDVLGVDLGHNRDRLGNLLVVFPESRIKTAVYGSKGFQKIGFDVLLLDPTITQLRVVVRALRNGFLVYSTTLTVGAGPGEVDCGTEFDAAFIEVLDPDTNEVVHRQGGPLLRFFNLAMRVPDLKADLSFDIAGPNGHTRKKPLKTSSSHGTVMRSSTGAPESPWIDRTRRFALRESKLLSIDFYSGTEHERHRAEDRIAEFLSKKTERYIKIWDPYFGPDDAAFWLTKIFDRSMPVFVLTAARPTPTEDERSRRIPRIAMVSPSLLRPYVITAISRFRRFLARVFRSKSPVDSGHWKRSALASVLAFIRTGRNEGPGLSQVKCRLASGNIAHDRFIITQDSFLVLGCSFNHIGSVVSMIAEFSGQGPEALFDAHWDQAGEENEV